MGLMPQKFIIMETYVIILHIIGSITNTFIEVKIKNDIRQSFPWHLIIC